jgi:hypothetical protein
MCSSLPSAPGLGPRAGRAARDSPLGHGSAMLRRAPVHPIGHPQSRMTTRPAPRLLWQSTIQAPAPISVSPRPKAAGRRFTHPCRTYGVARPAQRLDSTALGRPSLIRMTPLVQVLAGPPTNPAGQSVAAIKASALPVSLVQIWSTPRPTRHRRPPHESGQDGPATPDPLRGTDAHSGPR